MAKGNNIILVDGENSGEVFTIPHDGYMGSTFKQLWISEAMHQPYVLYFIQFYKELLRNSKKGAAIPHLNKEIFYSLVVRFLTATGARVSELIQIKVEHVRIGYFDIYSKGGKVRRLFIPRRLRDEAEKWFEETQQTTGYIFRNRFGERITTRGIAQQLKNYAERYGLNTNVVYPHSFRHRYAKNFLEAFNDIVLLADLMGHESIETTRIYLRRTASEKQAIVDKVITW